MLNSASTGIVIHDQLLIILTAEYCLLNPMVQLLIHLVLVISEPCLNSATASPSYDGGNFEQDIQNLQNLTSCLNKIRI